MTNDSPAATLAEAGIELGLLRTAWPSKSRTGQQIWRAVTRYIEPANVVGLAHLAVGGWAITIDVDRDGNGLLLTMWRDDS